MLPLKAEVTKPERFLEDFTSGLVFLQPHNARTDWQTQEMATTTQPVKPPFVYEVPARTQE